MKKRLFALGLLMAVGLVLLSGNWSMLIAGSPSASVSVTSSAGGTLVVPQGNKYVLWMVNTVTSNVADCAIGQTPTSTNWVFQLAANGGTWMAPQITYAPNEVGQPRTVVESITCIGISGSTTIDYYFR